MFEFPDETPSLDCLIYYMKQYSSFTCRLLQLSPNLQDTFPSFKGVALDELMNSRSLFLHSKRLMAVVEEAVSSLDDAQKFIDDLTKLGERHFAMSVTQKHLKVRNNCKSRQII